MSTASIPVDLRNPGQVFASLGFLEAADILCGGAAGGFDWRDDSRATFALHTDDIAQNPVVTVLDFLAAADIYRVAPRGYAEQKERDPDIPLRTSECFEAPTADWTKLPVHLEHDGHRLTLSHWCDDEHHTGRDPFKLYAGNRSAAHIAKVMLRGDNKDKTRGVLSFWQTDDGTLVEDPFEATTPLGGRFNFDARAAWTRQDAGYSPNDHSDIMVSCSPLVEILAAIGLEHARPSRNRQTGAVQYSVWGGLLPPQLARAAFGCAEVNVPTRKFQFLGVASGKNKIVTFARQQAHERSFERITP